MSLISFGDQIVDVDKLSTIVEDGSTELGITDIPIVHTIFQYVSTIVN